MLWQGGKGGDLLYRWGNPAAYGRGTTRDRKLFQQHDAQWIPDGCPGAGHILIFNNGLDRGYSTVEEIVPPMDSRGRYVLETGKAFGPQRSVWRYQATNPTDFYSSEISGAHRLPNGNTLICAGVRGIFFEVTPEGETVWEYVNPVVHNGILAQGEKSGLDHRGHNWNAVFKVHRYPLDYPGLAGRDLTPIGPIEQPASLCGKTGFAEQARRGSAGRTRSAWPAAWRRPGPMSKPWQPPVWGILLTVALMPASIRSRPRALLLPAQHSPRSTAAFSSPRVRPPMPRAMYVSPISAPAARTNGRRTARSRYGAEHTGSANGLAFDKAGNLLACESGPGRVTSIDPQGRVTVVADQYHGKRFNQPNDLWIDLRGGVYFTDPIYGPAEMMQEGEYVYYVSPDRARVVRVIDDLVRPNGLVGTPDGKMLYMSDHGGKKIYLYDIRPDGTLSHKRFFAPVGADGMKLDSQGNVYMAENGIVVYDSAGKYRETIAVPEQPTNLCFAGKDRKTLFITARTTVYTLALAQSGGRMNKEE